MAGGTGNGARWREVRAGWGELQARLFARDDDLAILAVLVDQAGRGTCGRADRAPDDGPDGPADNRADDNAGDATDDRAAGLFVTVARSTHVFRLDRFAPVDAVVPLYVLEPAKVTVIARFATVTVKSAVVAETL